MKFAEAISASSGYIAGIEVGNRKVNDRIIRLICITFNVSDKWLRTGEGEMFNKSPSRMTELACATFQELKPEYQDYVLKQIDLLLDRPPSDSVFSTIPYFYSQRKQSEQII